MGSLFLVSCLCYMKENRPRSSACTLHMLYKVCSTCKIGHNHKPLSPCHFLLKRPLIEKSQGKQRICLCVSPPDSASCFSISLFIIKAIQCLYCTLCGKSQSHPQHLRRDEHRKGHLLFVEKCK